MESERLKKTSGGSDQNLQTKDFGENQQIVDTGIASDTDKTFHVDTEQNDQATAGRNEHDDGQDLRHYMLARDRARREIRPPPKYAYADVIVYVLNIGDNIELDELVSYEEACNSKNKVD